ncbi:MAG: penicillin-binding protein 1C [Spirochaetia bacterium]|jgi:penicillin-binding protein 1C
MRQPFPDIRARRGLIVACAALSLAFAIGLVFLLRHAERALVEMPFSTAVYDRNGTLMRLTLSEDEKYRMKADLRDMPPAFVEALLLKEDRLFYFHRGVNPAALVRAFWHSLVSRDYRAGGSTITMQTARLLYGLDTGTLGGKLRQIAHALLLELVYPKRLILEAYASRVPCGRNVEGFPAASLLFFHKPLSSLSLSEMLLLCSVPQKPNERNPGSYRQGVLEARDLLYRMWLHRHPGDSELSLQFDMPEEFPLSVPFEAPHAVSSLLQRHAGETRISSTIDLRLQKTLQRMLAQFQERRAPTGIRNASALLVRAGTMEVLAEVGSADFFNASIEGQVNGTEAKRSPGSALKPFLYALAMDQGLLHPMTVLKDAPLHFSGYNPDNFDNDFEGPIRAKDALIKSRNVPAVFLSRKVKDPDMYDFLAKAGITGLRPKDDYGATLILGTVELTMKELAALYGMLANGGIMQPLRETVDAGGAAPARHRTLLSPQAAWLTLKILQEKPRPDELGAGPLYAHPRPCAWKTGTSIGFRDAWSIGIFDSFILCVWVGNFDGSGNPAFVGLRSAAPLMFEIIDALRASGLEKDYAGDPPPVEPPGIIRTKVCSVSGKIPNPDCPSLVDTWFIPGTSPIDVCDIHQKIYIDTRTGLRRNRPLEGVTRTELYEIWPSDLLALFEKAGLPRRQPPAFAREESMNAQAESGRPPEIASPLPLGEYAVRVGDPSYGEIPFIAVVPSDTARVYWFLNESYVGQSPGRKAFFWMAQPGTWVLRATDEHGRSSSSRFTVVLRQ